MNFKSVLTSKYRAQFSNRRSHSPFYPISMLFVVFSINLRGKSESSFSFTRDLLAITPSRLKSENRFSIIYELKLVFLN